MKRTTFAWLGNVFAFAGMIGVNAMATSIPLGGQTPPEISAKYPSLFTPAGFTFSIWGVIYLSLMLFIIYQSLPARRDDELIDKVDGLFKLSCVANATWIVVWHYELLILSIVIMACLLFCLVRIYARLHSMPGQACLRNRLLLFLPFSLYTAWISVAFIANISAVQNGYGWDDTGMNAVNWTWLKLAVAGAIGAGMILRKRDAAFALVIAWAAYGIAVKQAESPLVVGAAMMLALLSVLLVAMEVVRRSRRLGKAHA